MISASKISYLALRDSILLRVSHPQIISQIQSFGFLTREIVNLKHDYVKSVDRDIRAMELLEKTHWRLVDLEKPKEVRGERKGND